MGPHHLSARDLVPGEATLAIRPNRVGIVSKNTDGALPAVVEKATYVGSHMEYTLRSDFGALFAVDEQVEAALLVGEEIAVDLARSKPVLVPD